MTGDRSARARATIAVLVALLAATMLVSLASGASDASAGAVILHWLLPPATDAALSARDAIIIYDIRMPRVVLGVLIGAALAVSGAVMQGLFRNPLADPGLVGVSAGAGLGAVSMIVLGGTALAPVSALLGIYALPAAAFLGGLAVTLVLYRISTRRGQTSVATMLLAGIALAALAGAAMGLLIFMADDRQLRDLTFWNLGSLAGATWIKIAAVGPVIALALATAPFLARGLNALALGETTAHHLGIPVQRFKYVAIVAVAAATGVSVAVSGGIGFVGIVVPHLLRLLIGPDNRYLLPASALLGASLLLVADAISRTVVAPAELPIGVVTAAAGAPFFLWILLRKRGVLDL
jgi:iron complex transport system permease protein